MGPRYNGHIGVYLIEVYLEVIHHVIVCGHQFGRNSNCRTRACTKGWKSLLDVILNRRIGLYAVCSLPPDIWG